MEHDPAVHEAEETSALMENNPHGNNVSPHNPNHTAVPTKQDVEFAPEYVLPIALLAALAMASTAATAYFAYATLLCENPRHCKDGETSRYAGFVAGATCIANVFGMLALGYLQKLAMNSRLGLMLWMICRSMSAVMLLVGGQCFFLSHSTGGG
jgi:hypothetical protein